MKKKLITIPDELHEKILKEAIRDNRSVNKQITQILKERYE